MATTGWTLGLAFAAGLGLGAFFFGGLWWTVNQLETARNPGLLFAASFLIRIGLTVAGVWLVGRGQWQQIVACLLGFVLMRAILTRRWGPNRTLSADVEAGRHAA